ncbi:MAG: helix-turn-helix transcriptional regulator [Chloroflexi bacterium]|nr:helix-turn-helix transcriptional regulator [Chloroflexota bacterium]
MSDARQCIPEPMNEQEERLVKADSFIWDIVMQLYQLREQRGLSQAELAELAGTKQQSISRMENPGYDRHSLAMLRKVAEQLRAFVDVVIVPEEKLEQYLDARYQPVLMEEPPTVEKSPESWIAQSQSFHHIETISIPQFIVEKEKQTGENQEELNIGYSRAGHFVADRLKVIKVNAA